VLAQTQEGARLIMQNGNIEQGRGGGARLSVLKFERYVFDLDQYCRAAARHRPRPSERYLSELLNPPFPVASQPGTPRV
jgi:hypothetical protein